MRTGAAVLKNGELLVGDTTRFVPNLRVETVYKVVVLFNAALSAVA